MLKKTVLVLSILLANGSMGHAQWVVTDPQRIAEFAIQIQEIYKQVQTAEYQLTQARKMYESVTGDRRLGELFADRNIESLLPKDMKNLYGDLRKNGISGAVDVILKSERVTGSVEYMSKTIDSRQRRTVAAQKAIGLKAYDAAQRRLGRLEKLRQRIRDAGDTKAIGELQARLEVEQASIQAETNKLQLLEQMELNEDKLIELQRQELNRKNFNKNNNDMPKIK